MTLAILLTALILSTLFCIAELVRWFIPSFWSMDRTPRFREAIICGTGLTGIVGLLSLPLVIMTPDTGTGQVDARAIVVPIILLQATTCIGWPIILAVVSFLKTESIHAGIGRVARAAFPAFFLTLFIIAVALWLHSL